MIKSDDGDKEWERVEWDSMFYWFRGQRRYDHGSINAGAALRLKEGQRVNVRFKDGTIRHLELVGSNGLGRIHDRPESVPDFLLARAGVTYQPIVKASQEYIDRLKEEIRSSTSLQTERETTPRTPTSSRFELGVNVTVHGNDAWVPLTELELRTRDFEEATVNYDRSGV